jgi:CRP/FNR family transcriptional regulator, global nitrogen regulator
LDGPNSSTRRSASCSTSESTYVKDLLAELAVEGRQAVEHSYAPGDVIYSEGDEGNALYVLTAGYVNLYRSYPGGKEATVRLVGEGETFGDLAFGCKMRQHASAEALTPCTVQKIPKIFVDGLVRRSPEAALRVMDLRALEVEREREMAECRLPREIVDRVALLLAVLARRFGEVVEGGVALRLRLTHHDLAAMLCACREAVSTALATLRDRGEVQYGPGWCVLLDAGGYSPS